MHRRRRERADACTSGRRDLHGGGPQAGGAVVLVHQIQQHAGHVVRPALVPVPVDLQPVAQVPRLLTRQELQQLGAHLQERQVPARRHLDQSNQDLLLRQVQQCMGARSKAVTQSNYGPLPEQTYCLVPATVMSVLQPY